MFENFDILPPDPILGLIARFADDPHPDKVDLGVGVYRDATGVTPVMAAVHEAESVLVQEQTSKAYFGQAGDPSINPVLQDLVLGSDHPATHGRRASTFQTPGGSGALRIAAELLAQLDSDTKIWVPDPTWANHTPLLGASGLEMVTYPYLDRGTSLVDRTRMFEVLETARPGDAVVVHAACHNPTGADIVARDWTDLADLAVRRGLTVIVDSAYQGLGIGLEDDAEGIRTLAAAGAQMLVTTSFSKNFGLYRDRAGALTISAGSSRAVAAAHSNALRLVRRMYSVPPDHGAAVVGMILGEPVLRAQWEHELGSMRSRLQANRRLLVDVLRPTFGERFEAIRMQRGMFSLLGITPEQATALTEEHHIYLPTNGRINVAGLSESNVDRVGMALAAVLE